MATDVECCLKLLQKLVKSSKKQAGKQLTAEGFQQSLLFNLQSVFEIINNDPKAKEVVSKDQNMVLPFEIVTDVSTVWQYGAWNLKLISALCVSLSTAAHNAEEKSSKSSAPALSADVLGAQQQKTVLASLQFITCCALCPNIIPGVGVPFELRSEHAKLLVASSSEGGLVTYTEKRGRLVLACRVLMACMEQFSLATLVLSRCLGDLLAGLIQICYGPEPVTNEVEKSEIKVFSDRALKKLLSTVHPSLIVRELLLLQSGPPAQLKHKFSSPPAWLRKECARLLMDILLRPTGVQIVLQAMLDKEVTETSWSKCDAAANVIAHCPLYNIPIEDFYARIAPQLAELLHIQDKKLSRQYERAAVSAMSGLYARDQSLTEKYLLSPMLQPLLLCMESPDPSSSSDTVVCEKALAQCITSLYKISRSPSTPLLLSIRPVLHPLYKLSHLPSSIKPRVLDVLVAYFKHPAGPDVHANVQCLTLLAVDEYRPPKLPVVQEVRGASTDEGGRSAGSVSAAVEAFCKQLGDFKDRRWMCPELGFVLTQNGGMQVKKSDGHTESLEDIEDLSMKLILLLKHINRQDLTAELFLYLLEELGSLISSETKPSGIVFPGVAPSAGEMSRLRKNLLQLSMIVSLCDQMPDTCFTNTKHILRFAKVTLERCVLVMENTEDEAMGVFESETITMAMGLLTAVMGGGAPISPADRVASQELLPLLEKLGISHPDPSVQEMATDVRIAIATHGMVLSDLIKAEKDRSWKSKTLQENVGTVRVKEDVAVESAEAELKLEIGDGMSRGDSKKVLIEELPDDTNGDSAEAKKSVLLTNGNQDKVNSKTEEKSINLTSVSADTKPKQSENMTGGLESGLPTAPSTTLEEAFRELLDPLVPVRGHALITLRKLVERGDPAALARRDVLLQIFRENLAHGDSYIYLGAIQGMAALGEREPDVVLPVLAKEYNTSHGPELTMKLGEVLVKSCKSHGDVLGKYRELLLNSVLQVTKADDHLLRASAVSNLAELCRLLHFGLAGIVWEVVECVSGLVKGDPAVEVRQGAAMLICMLLQGLGKDAFKILGSALKELYTLLKHVMITEKEDSVKLHVRLALDELDNIMRDFLFPKQTLQKKITVLDPPQQPF